MFTNRYQRLAATFLFSFAFVHLLVTWSVRDRIVTGFPDYTIFYTAGTLIRRGMASHLYDGALQYQLQREFVLATQQGRGLLPYNHPPYEALLFVPLSYVPYMPGYVIWAFVNVVIFGFNLHLLRPHLPNLRSIHWSLWAVLPLAFFPAFASLFEGQDSILVLLLYTLVFREVKRGRPWIAGVWLALALFKFQLVLPFVAIAVLTRGWKLVTGFTVASLILAVANIALVGWHTALYYPIFLQRLEQTTAGGAIVPMNMPNLHGFIDAVFARTNISLLQAAATGLLSLVIVFVVARNIRRTRSTLEQNDLSFALAIVVSVLASYHLFWYDWTVLLLPALLTFNHLGFSTEIKTTAQRLLLLVSCSLFLSPLYLVPLARFGHLYGLAILLFVWGWALLRELQSGPRVPPALVRQAAAKPFVAQP